MSSMPVSSIYTTTIATLLCLLISGSIPGGNAQAPFYIFGDSLYDTGMTLYNSVAGDAAEFWPYGETYFNKPSGRYSDGRVIPDFLAQYAGLPLPKPYLLPGLNDFTKSVNFASSGACVLVETRPNTINLKMQVDYFTQMVSKLNNQVGQAKSKAYLSKAVFLFNIGGNDYVALLQNNMKKLPLSYSYKQSYVTKVLDHMIQHIQTIYKLGGRKFAIQNIGPLGCLPAEKNRFQVSGGCVNAVQELVKMHNSAFLNKIKQLETQLSGFKYTVYDSFDSTYKRVVNGNNYGFKITGTACCGTGAFNGQFTCEKKGTGFTVCNNPSDYLFFDAGHFTEKANNQISKEFWSGGLDVISPYNLQTFFKL